MIPAKVVFGVLLTVASSVAAISAPEAPTTAPTTARNVRQDEEAEAGERYRTCARQRRFSCCSGPDRPCVRSGVARLTLLAIGAVAGGTAAGVLFALGDRNGGGDPATFLVGGGALAGAGALIGSLAGRLGADAAGDPDRIRPSTVGLDYAFGRPAALDETEPHTMRLTFAPSYYFPGDGGRLRLFGHVGGTLWQERQVDPRPQNQTSIPGQSGTAPVVLRERRLSIGFGADLAVNLPYPVLAGRRSGFLGRSELRYKPEVQIRRETLDPGQPSERTIERTMFLPLTIGMRWHLSDRQRFTVYFGPRFDYIAFAEPGRDSLRRGGAQIGPLYGEAWYDLDLPMTLQPRRDGAKRRAVVNSQLSFGYVHSRFDGRGFNVGPVVGFLGPVHVRWATRIRPSTWPVALQGGAGVTVGNGVTASVNVGVVLPDLGRKDSR